eukprot:scaffold13916_cov29-Prasinocladus_malaysianus.AAC.1
MNDKEFLRCRCGFTGHNLNRNCPDGIYQVGPPDEVYKEITVKRGRYTGHAPTRMLLLTCNSMTLPLKILIDIVVSINMTNEETIIPTSAHRLSV